MFFDDPVAAFANIARAVRPGGLLAFCSWQPLAVNEWMLVPGVAAAQHAPLPTMTTRGSPFAMSDPTFIRSTLERAGFERVRLRPQITSILLGGRGTFEEIMEFVIDSGVGRAVLDPASAAARRAATEAVRGVLAPLVDDDGVRLGAAAWIVTASVPSKPSVVFN